MTSPLNDRAQPRVAVLGGGMVGRVMAADLARDFAVTLVDLRESPIEEVTAMARLRRCVLA